MNAGLGDDLGVRGNFVLGTRFGEIGLIADLHVVNVVMDDGVLRVAHGRACTVAASISAVCTKRALPRSRDVR